MKAFSYPALLSFLPILQKELVGRHLSAPALLTEETILFRISGKGNRKFVISLSNSAPIVYIAENSLDLHSLSSPFFDAFKKEISNPYVEAVSLLNEDRILSLSILSANNVFKEERKQLVLELFPGKANLLLLGENGKILLAFRPKGLETNRPLLKGLAYALPEKKDFASMANAPFECAAFQKEAEEYEISILARRKAERFAPFLKENEQKAKRAKRKAEAIKRDIEEAKKHIGDARFGNAILMSLGEIEKGSEGFSFDGEWIPLNPSLRPQENAERYFKRAKKAKETIQRSEANLLKANQEEEEAKDALYALRNGDEAALEALFSGTRKSKGKDEALRNASLPYFVEVDGTKILFGKNAKQNDTLTFLLETAKKHLWFHVLGERGPHVILKTDEPNEKLVSIASEIALFLAKKKDGEVQIAYRKDVRKGAVPGQAVLKEFHVQRVERIDEATVQLLETAKKVRD